MRPYLQRQAATGSPGWRRSGWRRSTRTCSPPPSARTAATPATRCGSPSTRPTGGSPASTSTCGTTDFGPAFIKVCAYFPYPVKVWLNGHEWAKQQATQAGIGFTELSNGFATCDDPAGSAGDLRPARPGHHRGVLRPVDERAAAAADRRGPGGRYWWELSMRQVETSRTIVFDAPRHARAFFEALVVDNLDIGRPDHVELIFAGHPRRWGRPPKTEPTYKTRIDTRDTIGVTVNADYKHSRVKQYLKDGRALRIETVINSPDDLICKRRLPHLDELQAKARAVNARLLDTERVGQGCVLASPAFERVAQSTLTEDGRRSPALRFGDPRVMALLGALCVGLNALGFTNRSLRAQVSQLLGVDLHRQPDELRPGPAPPQRPDPTPTATPTPTSSPPTGNASRSSTPRSTTDSCARSSPPTPHPPRSNSAAPWPSSTATSTATSTTPDSETLPETQDNRKSPSDQGSLATLPPH